MLRDSPRRVTLVVDSDPACGRGHLSRCLLLATALAAQGSSCRFLLTNPVEMPGLEIFPSALLGNSLPETGEMVVVDGYRFTSDFLEQLQRKSPRLVVIDDLGDRHIPAHVILNHNIYAETLSYSGSPGCALFLGPRYGLVRPDFFRLGEPPCDGGILITLGSGPLAARGCELASALRRHLPTGIEVVLGADARLPDHVEEGVRFHRWADLAGLAENASLVICGLGVTFLEILAARRAVIGAQIAPNQALAYRAAKAAGYAVFERIEPEAIALTAADALRGQLPLPGNPFQLDQRGPARAAAAILGSMH